MSALQGANALYLQAPKESHYLPSTQFGITDWGFQHELPRRTVRSATSIFPDRTSMQHTQTNHLEQEIAELRKIYIFPACEPIRLFLARRHAVRTVLLQALPQLRASFGSEHIFRLELSKEDDDSQTMYAVAICHGSVHTAVQALRQFEEDWWLDHMNSSTTDLAFVYEIA